MTNHRFKHLTLVSFSGAHATGKTTLLGDLAGALDDDVDATTTVAESCSQNLFQRIRSGGVRLPEGASMPTSYDDLNRLGLRGFFQRALPDALSFEVESAVLREKADLPLKPRTYVLVDRWFTDILAYTVMESSDPMLHDEVRDLCAARLHDLQTWLLTHADTVRIVNVFVPVRASNFKQDGKQAKKFRATGDRALWETVCLKHWRSLIPGRRGILAISTSDRKRRVAQVLEHLSAGQPKHA